jgi:uncharacterized heparinase superfamily protein
MNGRQLALLGRTAVHLRPAQVTHRVRLRAQRAALERLPLAAHPLLARRPPAVAVGWPAAFTPLDGRAPARWPGLAGLQSGQLQLLGMARTLGSPRDWHQLSAPLLWQFHLHYWDWAWGLAADPDRLAARTLFADLWQSWRSAISLGRGPAWWPYPSALRAWSFCGVSRAMVAGGAIENRFTADLAFHAMFLRRNLELDIGGNHLIKDLKALVGLAVFFADERLLSRTLRRLIAQLAAQVLPDGGHYERAPAYHCQVLGDLIDVAGLLRAAGRPVLPELDQAISRMQRWLEVVIGPAGQLPLLNDGYPVEPELLALLRVESRPADQQLRVLPATGLVRAIVGGWDMVADVGAPCPEDLPGHAHADTLACLVHADGSPLLVDTGTSTYAAGPARSYERSTAAHNTVEVDGADSTEVWGAFRAARRARVRDMAISTEANRVSIEAAHDGYRRLAGRPEHRRRWSLEAAGLQVEDLVTGRGSHAVTVRWHLAPGTRLRLSGGCAIVETCAGAFEMSVSADAPATLSAESQPVATGFGRTVSGPVLTVRLDTSLPVQITTVWRRATIGRLAKACVGAAWSERAAPLAAAAVTEDSA